MKRLIQFNFSSIYFYNKFKKTRISDKTCDDIGRIKPENAVWITEKITEIYEDKKWIIKEIECKYECKEGYYNTKYYECIPIVGKACGDEIINSNKDLKAKIKKENQKVIDWGKRKIDESQAYLSDEKLLIKIREDAIKEREILLLKTQVSLNKIKKVSNKYISDYLFNVSGKMNSDFSEGDGIFRDAIRLRDRLIKIQKNYDREIYPYQYPMLEHDLKVLDETKIPIDFLRRMSIYISERKALVKRTGEKMILDIDTRIKTLVVSQATAEAIEFYLADTMPFLIDDALYDLEANANELQLDYIIKARAALVIDDLGTAAYYYDRILRVEDAK